MGFQNSHMRIYIGEKSSECKKQRHCSIHFLILKKFIFNWKIIALQCYVSFFHTTT